MNIEVEGCAKCPFKSYYYDDFGIGNQDINSCELIKFFNAEREFVKWKSSYIKFDRKNNVLSKNKKTLDYCPLEIEEITVTLTT